MKRLRLPALPICILMMSLVIVGVVQSIVWARASQSQRLLAAIEAGDEPEVLVSLLAGADPNQPFSVEAGPKGRWDGLMGFLQRSKRHELAFPTPLERAVLGGNPEIVKLLLQYGADPVVVKPPFGDNIVGFASILAPSRSGCGF